MKSGELCRAGSFLATFAVPDVLVGVGWQKRAMRSNKAVEAA